MPTYEYRCPSCGNEFEKFQRMSDEPVAECPSCGARAERRLSGGAGLLFKGSGFYITDYRSEGYKASEKKEGSTASEAKSEAKSETKVETKTEAKKPEAKPAASEKPKASGKKD